MNDKLLLRYVWLAGRTNAPIGGLVSILGVPSDAVLYHMLLL
jgi:hypothetical protein